MVLLAEAWVEVTKTFAIDTAVPVAIVPSSRSWMSTIWPLPPEPPPPPVPAPPPPPVACAAGSVAAGAVCRRRPLPPVPGVPPTPSPP